MSRKADKLARELVALRLKYSDNDFDIALQKISSGELFEVLARALIQLKNKKRSKSSKTVASRSSPNDLSEVAKAAMAKLLEKIGDDAELRNFAEGIFEKKLLKNGTSMRGFAEVLSITLPKKTAQSGKASRTICFSFGGVFD